MERLDQLSDHQVKMLDVYRDLYTDMGLSIEPADKDTAESAIRDAYIVGGLEPPKIFIWLSSPLQGAIASAIIESNGEYLLNENSDDHIIKSNLADQLSKCGYGQHDASWLGFYAFLMEQAGISDSERIKPLMRLCGAAGWWWPFTNICIVTDRPCLLRRDDDHRLHCIDGPALQYRDGWSIYAWHGVVIPSEWITDKKSLSPKIALSWKNMEQRRAATEMIGWAKILKELDAVSIDTHVNPHIGELLEVEIPDSGRQRFVRVLCGTGREFAICVPWETKTALEAQAWMRGMTLEEFLRNFPEGRT